MMADVIPLHASTDDFLTVLTHPQARLSKEWLPDGTITPYSEGKHFKPGRLRVTDITSLSAALAKLQDSPRSCVVRGRYRGEEYSAANEPEHKPGTAMRRLSVFEDLPHHWLLIEVDTFAPLGADPVLEPMAAIEEYVLTLPEAFHEASYHWQMSNSAGSAKNRDVLKAHLWFWSETPYTSAQLKAWARAYNIDTDTSVFNPVQVHYTAAPTFADGVQDPIAQRCGLVLKHSPSVPLVIPDDLPLPAEKQHKLAKLQDLRSEDPVVEALNTMNLVRSVRSDGGLNIVCPREHLHSTGAGAESSTIYYLPNTGGYAAGHFKCLHDSCSQATDSDFLEAIGITVLDDFEEVPEPAPDEAPAENRFRVKSVSEFMTAAPMHWIVRNVLPSAALIVMYGASGSGKTFMALDLAGAVARGVSWCGNKTRKGRVIYVAAEGAGGARKRFHAYCQANDLDPDSLDIGIVDVAPNMMEKGNALLLAKAIADWHPDVCLIILDTFAQVMAGGNENSGDDVGKALGNCKILNRVVGCPVMLIHHSGKDESRGARGWSGLKAAADAELEVLSCEGDHVMTVTKMKDGDDSAEYPFRLDIVDLGPDLEGDLGDRITSCVVEHQTGASAIKAGKPQVMKKVDVILYNALSGRAVPGTFISEVEVIALAEGAGLEASPAVIASAFKRMVSQGRVVRENGAVCIPAPLF